MTRADKASFTRGYVFTNKISTWKGFWSFVSYVLSQRIEKETVRARNYRTDMLYAVARIKYFVVFSSLCKKFTTPDKISRLRI